MSFANKIDRISKDLNRKLDEIHKMLRSLDPDDLYKLEGIGALNKDLMETVI